MARSYLLIPLTLLACAGDQGVKAFNAEPVGEITSHGDGDEVYEGYTESFRALVSDPDHTQDSLTVTWYAAGEVACEATAAESDGLSTCDVLIASDTTEVSLEVVDPGGAAGSARVDLTVIPTESPEAEITAPTSDGVYYSDQKVSLEGIVTDAEDASPRLQVSWESDIDGELSVVVEPNDDGEVTGPAYLSEGEHYLTLRVEDTTGKTGSDSVIITVGPRTRHRAVPSRSPRRMRRTKRVPW